MLRWAFVFAVLAIIAGVFGLANVAMTPSGGERATFFSLLGIGGILFALEIVIPKR